MQIVAIIVTHAPDKYCKIVEMSVDVEKIVVKLIDSIILFCQQCKSIHNLPPRTNVSVQLQFLLFNLNGTCHDLSTCTQVTINLMTISKSTNKNPKKRRKYWLIFGTRFYIYLYCHSHHGISLVVVSKTKIVLLSTIPPLLPLRKFNLNFRFY